MNLLPWRVDGRLLLRHCYERVTCAGNSQLLVLQDLWHVLKSAVSGLPLPSIVTYQSPLPVFRPLGPLSLLEFPAAAEAKLEVNGEGMIVCVVM